MISPVTNGEGVVYGKLVHRLFEKLDWSQPGLLQQMAEIEGKDLGATGPMIKRARENKGRQSILHSLESYK